MTETCLTCGRSLSAGARFCRACGAPSPTRGVDGPEPDSSLRCGACHHHSPGGSRFCRACGAALGPVVSAVPPGQPGQAPRPPEPVRFESPDQVMFRSPDALRLGSPERMPGSAPPPAGRRSRVLVAALAAGLAVALAGIALLLLTGHQDSGRGGSGSHPNVVTDVRPPPAAAAAGDTWPQGVSAWTIQVASFRVYQDARDGLSMLLDEGVSRRDGGVLHSDGYTELLKGYWVVYAGQFSSRAAATASPDLRIARDGAFRDAFARYISPAG